MKADDQWLLDHEVQPWMEMPLWIPDDAGRALMQVSIEKGLKQGLKLYGHSPLYFFTPIFN